MEEEGEEGGSRTVTGSLLLVSSPMAIDGNDRGGVGGGGAEPSHEPASAAQLEDADLMFAQRGCCCFWVPHYGSRAAAARRGASWEQIVEGAPTGAAAPPECWSSSPGRPWWRRAMTKVRKWSDQITAGPRWKTFVRRLNRRRHHQYYYRPRHHRRTSSGASLFGGGWTGASRASNFHYDPLSYALNFDEGPHGDGGGGDDDDDLVYRNFSARYVLPVPSSAKSSMDFGGRDAPPLFRAA